MEGRVHCDYCVVGAGMIGSAAAKHLQVLNPTSRVVLVGPSEPKVCSYWFYPSTGITSNKLDCC